MGPNYAPDNTGVPAVSSQMTQLLAQQGLWRPLLVPRSWETEAPFDAGNLLLAGIEGDTVSKEFNPWLTSLPARAFSPLTS